MKTGSILIDPESVAPPGPVSGVEQKKCLFAATRNCGGGISGDHIISASVLRQIALEKILIHSATVSRTVGIHGNSVKVKRLCRRHNSALTRIDEEAGRFFRGVQSFHEALLGHRPTEPRVLFFHAFDLERWLLKTMLAVFYARLSNVVPDRHVLPAYVMDLFKLPIGSPFGLFVPTLSAGRGQRETMFGRRVRLYLLTEDELVCGIEVSLGGIELRLVIAGSESSVELEHQRAAYRPKFLNLFLGREVFTLALASAESSGSTVWVSSNKDEAPPTDPEIATP